MSSLEKFKCSFNGSLLNSSGSTYDIECEVICSFTRIVPTLYKKYKHISNLKIVDMEGRVIDVNLARSIADWGDD